jgi:hypothetical protein
MGIIELSVLGFVAITVFMGIFTAQQINKRRGTLGIEREPDEAAGSASTLVQIMRAKARGMAPGRMPLDALPVRDEAPDWLEEATRWLELEVTVEEDATARQSDDAQVCRIVLRERRSGAAWELELVCDGEWEASPGGDEAAATFTTRGKIEDAQARRRFVGAFGEAMGLGAPPLLDGDEDTDTIKLGHYGIVELEGRRWEALRFELTVGTIYPLWLLMDRGAGQARLLVNTDPEERPMVVIGMELATRGVGALQDLYEVPAVASRAAWVTEFLEVGGAAQLEDADLEGRCVGGRGETLCAVIQDDEGIKVLRWGALNEQPEVLYRDEDGELLEVSWSGCGERVYYRVEGERGYRGYDLGMRTAYKGLLADLDGESDYWEFAVGERWPLLAVAKEVDDEDDEDESVYELRVVELDGTLRWSMSTSTSATYVDVIWTDLGLYIETSYEDDRIEHLLWAPGDREARAISDRGEAGPQEGRPFVLAQEGYGAQFVDASGGRRGRWTPSYTGDLDTLYFWAPREHIWVGDRVILDDHSWSVVEVETGEVRPLFAEAEAVAVELLAGGQGWIVAKHQELGLVWARLGGAQGAAANGACWGGAW